MKQLKLCPRSQKTKSQRTKTALTIDKVLWDKLQEYYEAGYSISHMVDSGLWLLFDKPKLSFEEDKPESPTLFDKKPIKCCGE